ncbi:hypothetical protein T439DRAFT_326828 [Meredithblackwellia eburnea MCA 4105]
MDEYEEDEQPVAGPSSLLNLGFMAGDGETPSPPSGEEVGPQASAGGGRAGADQASDTAKPSFRCREGCNATFGTQGHRSRHERSHRQDLRNECPRCKKKFVRSDVLTRHIAAIHGEGPERKGRKPSCFNCSALKVRCEGLPGQTCDRCAKQNAVCVYKKGAAGPRSASTDGRNSAESDNGASSSSTNLVAPVNFALSPFGSLSPHNSQESPDSTHSLHSVHSVHSMHSMQSHHTDLHQTTPATSHPPLPNPSVDLAFQASPVIQSPPLSAPPSNQSIHQSLTSLDQGLQRLQSPPPPDFPYASASARASAALQSMPAFDYVFSTLPEDLFGGGDAASSFVTFDNSLGWGISNTEADLLAALGTYDPNTSQSQGPTPHFPQRSSGTVTPSTDWLLSLTNFQGASAFPTDVTSGSGQELQPLAEDEEEEAAKTIAELSTSRTPASQAAKPGPSSENSPWPHVYRPPAEADMVNLPPVTPAVSSHTLGPTTDEISITESTFGKIFELIESTHTSPWPQVSLQSFPSAATLSVCVNLYFQRFHPTFPILDWGRISSQEVETVLLLAIAAIGSTYSPQLEGLGVALTELVRRAIAHLREVDPRLKFEVYIVQAALLNAIFSLFSGSRKLYHEAEVARSSLVTAARRLGLLRSNTTAVEHLSRRQGLEVPSPEEWRAAYLEDEERLRLGWGIYIFDNQMSTLLNLQALFSVSEISESTLLPIDGRIFHGDSANLPQWIGAPSRPLFRKTLEHLITKGSFGTNLTPFGTVIMSLTLYRLCLDATYTQSIFTSTLALPSTPTSNTHYTLPFPTTFKHHPQAVLESLATSWYIKSANPSPMMVASTAYAHHAAIAFSTHEFIAEMKVCAGKYGPLRGMAARQRMESRMNANVMAVRRTLVHAAQLSCLLMRFTFDTPAEVCWLTDAAITIWGIIKFGSKHLSGGPTALGYRTTLKWSDTDSLEPWIKNGGPLTIKGTLGDVGSLTPARVLADFTEKIETLPWGLWRRFRGVLTTLAQEEGVSRATSHDNMEL